jgi:hypothetical protein
MNMNEDKSLALEFRNLLQSRCRDTDALKGLLIEFISTAPERRSRIAKGMLAIGADKSERPHDRNFALQQLSTFICKCEIPNDHSFEAMLSDVIDDWTQDSQGCGTNIKPTGALTALFMIDQELGLQKLDQTIERYGDLDLSRDLKQLRKTFELMRKGIRPTLSGND